MSAPVRSAKARGLGRPSNGSQLAAGAVVLVLSYLGCFALYGGLRVAHVTHPTSSTWPYAETKVYDPYGEMHDAGIPGPYYR